MNKKIKQVAKGSLKVAKTVAKPMVKFGKFLRKNNQIVNDSFNLGARP